jgi:hypothetical protein
MMFCLNKKRNAIFSCDSIDFMLYTLPDQQPIWLNLKPAARQQSLNEHFKLWLRTHQAQPLPKVKKIANAGFVTAHELENHLKNLRR